MKYIVKNKTGIGYRELLAIHKADGCYDDVKDDKSKSKFTRKNILKDLLEEQGYICAYCMSSINENSASIEHIVGQKYSHTNITKTGKHLDTDYNNILAVCNGNFCADLHCDKSRAKFQSTQPLLSISPLKNLQMQNISFTKSGKIKYNIDDNDIENDLNVVLNLNCKTLIENRGRVKTAVRNNLIRKHFNKDYAIKQLEYWKNSNEPYPQVAVEELRKHI
jgi:uncharacterized protein (TIGR02646 family)